MGVPLYSLQEEDISESLGWWSLAECGGRKAEGRRRKVTTYYLQPSTVSLQPELKRYEQLSISEIAHNNSKYFECIRGIT
jgi:hypothetical protein